MIEHCKLGNVVKFCGKYAPIKEIQEQSVVLIKPSLSNKRPWYRIEWRYS